MSRAKVNIVGALAHTILDASVAKLGAPVFFQKANPVNVKHFSNILILKFENL